MKHKIFKRYRTGKKKGGQHYHIGRMLNYGSHALRRITPKNLFLVSEDNEDVLRPRHWQPWGETPKKLLKEYPELISLAKEQNIKSVTFLPQLGDVDERERLAKENKMLLGRYYPKGRTIEIGLYHEHNFPPHRSIKNLSKTLLHELRHAEQSIGESSPMVIPMEKSEKEKDAYEYETDKYKEFLGNKLTVDQRKRKAMETIFK